MGNNKYINSIAALYGYKNNNHYAAISKGDEVIIYDHKGIPVVQDLVEAVTKEAVKVGGSWWHDFEYSVKKLND